MCLSICSYQVLEEGSLMFVYLLLLLLSYFAVMFDSIIDPLAIHIKWQTTEWDEKDLH